MSTSKRKGYLLIEMVIGLVIIVIIASFLGKTIINVSRATNTLRAEKEMHESALNLEGLIKINLKSVNALSHILFDGIIINDNNIFIDVEYEVDAIAFSRFKKNTTVGAIDQFVLAKDKGSSSTRRGVLWFMKMGQSEKLSNYLIKNKSKYEAGNYISKMYIEKINESRFKMTLDLEYKGVKARHSFTLEIL